MNPLKGGSPHMARAANRKSMAVWGIFLISPPMCSICSGMGGLVYIPGAVKQQGLEQGMVEGMQQGPCISGKSQERIVQSGADGTNAYTDTDDADILNAVIGQ